MIWRLLLISVLFSSCRYNAFVKRRYTKGYFVSAHGKATDIKAHTTSKEVLYTSEKPVVVFVNPVVASSAEQNKKNGEKIPLRAPEASKGKTTISVLPVFTPLDIAPASKQVFNKRTEGLRRSGNGILYVLGFFVMTFFYTMMLLSNGFSKANLNVVVLIAAIMALITLITGAAFI